jgi:hypothetical protein
MVLKKNNTTKKKAKGKSKSNSKTSSTASDRSNNNYLIESIIGGIIGKISATSKNGNIFPVSLFTKEPRVFDVNFNKPIGTMNYDYKKIKNITGVKLRDEYMVNYGKIEEYLTKSNVLSIGQKIKNIYECLNELQMYKSIRKMKNEYKNVLKEKTKLITTYIEELNRDLDSSKNLPFSLGTNVKTLINNEIDKINRNLSKIYGKEETKEEEQYLIIEKLV